MLAHESSGVLNSGQTITLTINDQIFTTTVNGEVDFLGSCGLSACDLGVHLKLFPQDFTANGINLSGLALVANTPAPLSFQPQLGGGSFSEGPIPEPFDLTATGTASASGLFGLLQQSGTVTVGATAASLSPTGAVGGLTVDVGFASKEFELDADFPFLGNSDAGVPGFRVDMSIKGTLTNQPPVAVASELLPLECTSPQGAAANLNGTGSSDPDNDIAFYAWWQGLPRFGIPVGTGQTVSAEAPIGTTIYSLSVGDSHGQIDDTQTQVTVVDTTPPVIDSISVTPSCLWPPDREMVLFRVGQEIQVSDHDTCDPSPVAFLKNVQDSQPFSGGGQGNTTPDFRFGAGAACLRAERQGTQNPHIPRIYTLTVGVRDHAGNEIDREVQVIVPHDQSQGLCPNVPPSEVLLDSDPACVAALASNDAGTGAGGEAVQPAISGLPRGMEHPAHGCSTGAGDLAFAAAAFFAFLPRRKRWR